jgi:hypothetical protein
MNIPKIIFIVPYRNREYEKVHFSIYMKYLMEDYSDNDYAIYYGHQNDNRPFNRGATKNIGFLVLKKLYPEHYKNITFVFNDIDTLPFKKNLLNYKTTLGNVKHFYGFNFALGGIVSITGEDFEKCNGYINNWGWGLEDNALNDSVLKNNIKIDRNQFYPLKSKEFMQIFDSVDRIVNNNDPGRYINKNFKDNLLTITNLDYNIECNYEEYNKELSNQFIININNFFTLIDPAKEKFYTQNIKTNPKLKSGKLERIERNKQWNMFKYL